MRPTTLPSSLTVRTTGHLLVHSAVAALLGTWAAGQAWAQQAPPADADTALPDITVTATRQPQRVQATAAAVSVVTGAQVREAGVGINLSESLSGVPGLAVLNRQNLAQDLQISSRGFGARATFGVRGVRLYEDGIPLTMPDGQGQSSSFDLSAARRIEVLRGPASAMYGNASGGVISLFTADGGPVPQLSVARAMGRDATQKTTVSASGQRGDVNYVADVSQASTDGFREHSKATREQWHTKLGWQLSTATKATLVASYTSMPDVQDPLGLTRDQWQANPSQAGSNALAYNTRKAIDHSQVGLVLNHQLDDHNQLRAMVYTGSRSATQWQAILANTQGSPANPGGVIDLGRQFGGLDLRYAHQGTLLTLPWQMAVGSNVDSLREHRQGFQNFDNLGPQGLTGVTGALRRDELNRADNRDIYLFNQLQLATDWQASLGWRQSQVAFHSRDQYVVSGNGNDSGRMDFAAHTPTASLMWQLTPNWQTYLSLGRSFETPTLNEVAYSSSAGTVTGWNTSLQSETATHREWGSKFTAGPSYSGTLALFDVNTDHEIAVQTNSGGRATYQNVGHTHRQGLELDGQWQVQRHWQANWAATWTTAHYQDPFTSTSTGNTQQVSAGSNLPGVPSRVLSAELQWQPAGEPWHTALSWRHSGRIWANDVNDSFAPSCQLWSVRAVWHTMLSDWRLDALARVDNLLNAHTVGSVIVNEGNRRYFEPAPGRSATVGLTLTHTFD
jgi:iron complex outermembrane receptor protein